MPAGDYTIRIEGVDRLLAKLGKLGAVTILKPPMQRAVYRIMGDVKQYPPEPAGTKYRRGQDPRSEDLGGRWTGRVTPDAAAVLGKVGNNASYAPWVQSHQFQARHMSHWKRHTDLAIIDKNRKAIVDDFAREIAKAINE